MTFSFFLLCVKLESYEISDKSINSIFVLYYRSSECFICEEHKYSLLALKTFIKFSIQSFQSSSAPSSNDPLIRLNSFDVLPIEYLLSKVSSVLR